MKITNSRLDVASHKRFPKEDLFRFVNIDGKLLLDEDGTLPGRGFYLRRDKASIALVKKKGTLARVSKGASVDDALYARLEELC